MVLPLGSCVIYALVDPREGTVRYVGVTNNPQRRFGEHLRKSTRTPKLTAWIDELRKEKLLPVFVFLDSIRAEKSLLKELEWIQHFEKIAPLYNHRKK